MNCAIMCLDDLSASYWSSYENECESDKLRILLNDFDDLLPEGEAVVVTLNENEEVVLMEYTTSEMWLNDEFRARAMSYSVMKAYCQAYGLTLATPVYVGPYSLEVAKQAYDRCGDFMSIIPMFGEVEVDCAS